MNFSRQINQTVANVVAAPALNGVLTVSARALMAYIFIMAGIGKLGAGYAGTQGYMQSVGLPGELLPLVILLEIGGGLALLAGFQARLAGLALAVFSMVSAFIFHSAADPMQQIMFMKNMAMAGGLLAFTVFGAGRWSLDAETR
ncbi:MAG: DoxX family protein [Moraxellaceae bacterium]